MTKPALIWQAWPIASHDSRAQRRDVIDPNDVTHSRIADYPVVPRLLVLVDFGGKYSGLFIYSQCSRAPVRPTVLVYGECFDTCTRVIYEIRLFIFAKSHVPRSCSWLAIGYNTAEVQRPIHANSDSGMMVLGQVNDAALLYAQPSKPVGL